MNLNLTDVNILLDRSGSMESCRVEAENGVNHFIESQKKDGDVNLTLAQFDNEFEYVTRNTPIKQVGKFKLVPRGMTALLDAVGRLINETGERLSKMNESDRPGLVVVVIVTDGIENASHEFTKSQIKSMIERQTKDYNWQFTYLGANQDAFGEARGLGIDDDATVLYGNNKTYQTFGVLDNSVKRMKLARASGQSVLCSYTNTERTSVQ